LANGHNDSSPNKALPAGPDNLPCFQTVSSGPNACGEKGSQKRTLQLSNGEIIWDFAGNVWQWVDATISRMNEPRTIIPGEGNYRWTWGEFITVPENFNYSPPNRSWDSKNGVGRIYHYNSIGDTDATLYTYIRGGNWRHGEDSGAFTIHMQPIPGKTGIDDVGFRCATSPI
jgi:formylglycine-generating enzyme required for sulfatase activity